MEQAPIDGSIMFYLMVAGILTLAFGWLALLSLQWSILRNMSAHRTELVSTLASEPVRQVARVPLVFELKRARELFPGPDPASPILCRAAAAQVCAGLAFAVTATVLVFRSQGLEFFPIRTIIFIWTFFWPTAIVLSVMVGPDRRFQSGIFAIYFGGLFILCFLVWLVDTPSLPVFGVSVPGFLTPVVLAFSVAWPSLFLLLFLNRSIRTTGPLILTFLFVLLSGALFAIRMLASLWVPGSPLALALIDLFGGWALLAVALFGMSLMAWPAWRIVAWLRDRYAAKRSSDLLITTGAIWLFQALALAADMNAEDGALGALSALIPLIAWRLAVSAGLRPVVAAAKQRPQSDLLLLRVFGFGRRSRRLLDLLSARWRLLGSITLIAAPDLASRTIEPSTFLEFIQGHLSALFIATQEQLRARLAAVDRQPDPDGRFRINKFFCSDDMWKGAVTRLMSEASLVVMDLRGFNPARRGCVFELETLLDTVPLKRLVLLVDRLTDQGALKQLLAGQWQKLSIHSPNATSGNGSLQLLEVEGNDRRAVRHLLTMPIV